MRTLELSEQEVAYLDKTLQIEHKRLSAWFERGSRVHKMEEVKDRLKHCESLIALIRRKT